MRQTEPLTVSRLARLFPCKLICLALGVLVYVLMGPPTATAQSIFADAGGFRIADDEGNYQLRIGGDLQTDARTLLRETPGSTSAFFLRRARVRLSATVQRRFSIRFMSNFGRGRAAIQDAYLDFRFGSGLSLRAGRFSTPLGLEVLQSANSTMQVERGYPSEFVANRDVGFQLHGRTLGRRLEYSVGVFNGALDGANADGDDTAPKDFMVRLFIEPWRNDRDASEWLRGLGIGFGTSTGIERGTSSTSGLASYRTLHGSPLFTYRTGVEADGQRFRIVPQAYYYVGPFGLIAEYARSQHSVQQGNNEESLGHVAWQVGGSWVITGESASYSGVTPANSYDPANGAWGAFEVSTKVQRFQFDENAFPQYANPDTQIENGTALAIGLSWYPVQNVRFMTTAERTTFGGTDAANARDDEYAATVRMQLAF
jgi:phosphate-selective porin OprO/OprP